MCGIAGYVANNTEEQSKLKTVSAIMAAAIESRGGQAWGTIREYPGHSPQIVKGVGPITDGLHLPLFMPQIFVMHTRFGTHGENSVANAHPFIQGQVIGVHNGVISNHAELNAGYDRTFPVDSQHIFQHIDEGREALADIRGYGAIIYTKGGQWFGGTFNHGDLEVANTPIGKVFASTRMAVRKACSLADIEILSWDRLVDDTIYRFTPENSYISFSVIAKGTTWKWQEGAEGAKKKEGEGDGETTPRVRLALPASTPINGIEIEEHDETTTGITCAHCYGECLPENYYRNDSTENVCSDCARGSYAYIAPEDYFVNHNGGKYDLKCDLCGTDKINPIITLVVEDMMICQGCFDQQFNTTGLKKVTTALVN